MARKFWNFVIKDEGNAELYMYGDISSTSWWGDEVTPKAFKEDLDKVGESAILTCYINSDGGDVFAGQAIRSMIARKTCKKKVAYVDGLAASIASVILTGFDEVVMPKNAMQMVHNPWTIAIGNASDMRKIADDLDKISESLIEAYKEKTGLDDEKIREMMEHETWLTAEECLELGFADKIEESKQVAASLDGAFFVINNQKMNLSKYKNAPKFIISKNEAFSKDKAVEEAIQKQKYYELIGGM